jgi:hypothetical protein
VRAKAKKALTRCPKHAGRQLAKELDATGRDVLESFQPTDVERKRTLGTPSIASLIQAVRPGIVVATPDANAAIDAMRTAADTRTVGILGNSRRRHYGHAALLVASCVAFAPKGRYGEFVQWAAELRQRYLRRHAFRQELTRAFGALGVCEVACSLRPELAETPRRSSRR